MSKLDVCRECQFHYGRRSICSIDDIADDECGVQGIVRDEQMSQCVRRTITADDLQRRNGIDSVEVQYI